MMECPTIQNRNIGMGEKCEICLKKIKPCTMDGRGVSYIREQDASFDIESNFSEAIVVGKCSHLFHAKCYNRWNQYNENTCPTCGLLEEEDKKLFTYDPYCGCCQILKVGLVYIQSIFE